MSKNKKSWYDDRGCPHLIEAMRAVAVGNMLVRSLIAEKNGGSTFSQKCAARWA